MSLEKRARHTAGDSRAEAAAHCSKWNRGGSLLDLHTSERQEGDEGDAAGSEGGGGLVWYVKGERNNGLRGRCDDDDVSGMEIHSSDRDRSRSRSRSAVPFLFLASHPVALPLTSQLCEGQKGSVGRLVGVERVANLV